MTRAEWLALAERCENAPGPDRELDAAILHALGFIEFGTADDGGIHWAIPRSFSSFEGRPSSSLDAITELLEETLPGWEWSSAMSRGHGRANVWRLSPMSRGSFPPKHCTAATEPLARCAAFCAAMAERAGQ